MKAGETWIRRRAETGGKSKERAREGRHTESRVGRRRRRRGRGFILHRCTYPTRSRRLKCRLFLLSSWRALHPPPVINSLQRLLPPHRLLTPDESEIDPRTRTKRERERGPDSSGKIVSLAKKRLPVSTSPNLLPSPPSMLQRGAKSEIPSFAFLLDHLISLLLPARHLVRKMQTRASMCMCE